MGKEAVRSPSEWDRVSINMHRHDFKTEKKRRKVGVKNRVPSFFFNFLFLHLLPACSFMPHSEQWIRWKALSLENKTKERLELFSKVCQGCLQRACNTALNFSRAKGVCALHCLLESPFSLTLPGKLRNLHNLIEVHYLINAKWNIYDLSLKT